MPLAMVLMAGGALLLIGGIKGVHPWSPLVEAFGGTPPEPPGTTGDAALAESIGATLGATLGGGVSPGHDTGGGGGLHIAPVAGCTKPRNLTTRNGITLQVPAMAAFQRAQRAAGGRIRVGSSYRSCDEQRAVCRTNCCGNENGCSPGCNGHLPCAKPGTSNHQKGLAVDIEDPGTYGRYLVAAGFFPLAGDPPHFTYGSVG